MKCKVIGGGLSCCAVIGLSTKAASCSNINDQPTAHHKVTLRRNTPLHITHLCIYFSSFHNYYTIKQRTTNTLVRLTNVHTSSVSNDSSHSFVLATRHTTSQLRAVYTITYLQRISTITLTQRTVCSAQLTNFTCGVLSPYNALPALTAVAHYVHTALRYANRTRCKSQPISMCINSLIKNYSLVYALSVTARAWRVCPTPQAITIK